LSSGEYSLGDYRLQVAVPSGNSSSSFPVLILLHKLGSNGATALRMVTSNSLYDEVTATHILVAPEGKTTSWNVNGECSKDDDTGFVGVTLVEALVGLDNVLPRFSISASSNGAGLANRILVENDDPRITTVVSDSTQLNTYQHHDGHFFVGGEDNLYTRVKHHLCARRLLFLNGGKDAHIPATGGESGVVGSFLQDGSDGSPKSFLSWRRSLYEYAYAYKLSGPAADVDHGGHGAFERVTYLEGAVQAYVFKHHGHVLVYEKDVAPVVAKFLLEDGGPRRHCKLGYTSNSLYDAAGQS